MIPFSILTSSTASNITFDIQGGEQFFYKFQPTGQPGTVGWNQPTYYYTLKSNDNNLQGTGNVHNSVNNEPYLYEFPLLVIAPADQTWLSRFTYLCATAGSPWGNWPISGESNEYSWTDNNIYWIGFYAYGAFGAPIDINLGLTGGSTTVKVYRNGIYMTLSTTAKFNMDGTFL